ncbi:cbhB [Symbiodinium natans]|uniref:CbhB protein n=1 Tax=Symbiodinium natans TaxID=878477 RepID=A0A812IEQ0_9DINO|nr:cbhB [Symbiodinium natans]
MLDLLNPDGAWSKVGDTLRSGRLDAVATVLHGGKTLLIFGGHDGSQLNEFGDPAGGYAPPSDSLAVRLRADGSVAAARYAGKHAGNQTSSSSLIVLRDPDRVLALGPGMDEAVDRARTLTALRLSWKEGSEEPEDLDALQLTSG